MSTEELGLFFKLMLFALLIIVLFVWLFGLDGISIMKSWFISLKPGDKLIKKNENPFKDDEEITVLEVKNGWIKYKYEEGFIYYDEIKNLYAFGWKKID